MQAFHLSTALAAIAAGAVAAIGFAAPAGAALAGDNSAADVITNLQQQGYSVQINGAATVALAECRATGVHGVPDSGGTPALRSTTVYVDISCPSDN